MLTLVVDVRSKNRAAMKCISLQREARRLDLERYVVDRPIDSRRHYPVELPVEAPFMLRRLRCLPTDPVPPLLWHTFLEVFVPLSPRCGVQMGSCEIDLTAGDLLLMDNLRLHAVRPIGDIEAQWVVIRFMPEFVLGIAPSPADRVLLLPFYYEAEEPPRLVRSGTQAARELQATLRSLLRCWSQVGDTHERQAGCKAYFTLLLYQLALHFGAAQRLKTLYSRQRHLTDRLRKLFAHIERNPFLPISRQEAAAMTGLGRTRFHAIFKDATGTTLLGYLNHRRLNEGARLLRETDRTIAEIANEVGYSDQSYFNRHFRRLFGCPPTEYRRKSTRSVS